ncbi:MFS superfamily sulfate permease-like transporter [Curtobacterium sp. PhB130]|uniref:SulP family inorganic anion transporter n=1 Tax=unclassified Curtobacterium TaxID=257496 RepID=UPI000F4D0017|nr:MULTISPECIES: SulP family inorganic anion transporter [unclassified Curtobacterium]ROS73844.1 MFS superfamily sulfate permease-like transporter [Curtobacterium sp. PhB130]TCK60207.1 MFS superfamily sulfate permease-like transporter [Curtobacterium sp. PhB136]
MTTRTAVRSAWFAPTLRGYDRAWLGRDVVAGLSAGAVVVPQAMAYATIADLPVQVGLYTCMAPMVVYALLGGSRAMSVSTTSTIATLTATTFVAADVAANADDAPRALATLTLIVGVVLVLARLLSLGSLVENINKATLAGVQIGVGATVAVGQLPKLLGLTDDPTGRGFIRSLVAVVEAVPRANGPTVVLSVLSIAVLLLLRRFAPHFPAPLVVVAGGIIASAALHLTDVGVEVIPAVPNGLPMPAVPDLTLVPGLLPGALGIATMAFLESAAVARGIRARSEPQIDSDRELLATAVANLAGSVTQSLPAAGGFSQSAVNQRAGARSQLSTLVTAALAVLVALVLGPVLALMPTATLAALVVTAVVGLIDIAELRRMARISRRDFWLAVLTAVVGLTAGLLGAVLVGVLGTYVLILRELQRVRLVPGAVVGRSVSARVDGDVYTANVLGYENAAIEVAESSAGVDALVLDLSRMRAATVTILDALRDLDQELEQRGVTLILVGLDGPAADTASRSNWFRGLVGQHRVFPSVEAAQGARRDVS